MSISFALIFVMVMAPTCLAIECYTGLKIVAGQTIGTETIHCDNSNAYCYNMTANAAVLIDIVKRAALYGDVCWLEIDVSLQCFKMFQSACAVARPIDVTSETTMASGNYYSVVGIWSQVDKNRITCNNGQEKSRTGRRPTEYFSTRLQNGPKPGNAIIITDYFTNSHELHPTDSSEDISSNIPQKYGNEQKQEITSSITKSHTNSHKPHSSDSHGDLPSTTLRGNENSQKQESTNTMTAFHTNSHELHSTNSYGDTSSIISHRYGDEQKREKTNSITVLHTNSREPHSTDSDDNLSGTIHIP